MDDLLTVENPDALKYLIKIAEEKGMKDIPIPIKFAKEILDVLKQGTVKRTFP